MCMQKHLYEKKLITFKKFQNHEPASLTAEFSYLDSSSFYFGPVHYEIGGSFNQNFCENSMKIYWCIANS